jgi:predicted DNA-binding ribbon-helix-helix protein
MYHQQLEKDVFFDRMSKTTYNQLTKEPSIQSRVMLNIDQFEIATRYVTAKVQNRYGENVTINIQGGRPGIELQESFFFKMKEEQEKQHPSYAYLIARLVVEPINNNSNNSNKVFVRKLPVVGKRDWLLIYDDTLLELSVKDAYDELEIVVV